MNPAAATEINERQSVFTGSERERSHIINDVNRNDAYQVLVNASMDQIGRAHV